MNLRFLLISAGSVAVFTQFAAPASAATLISENFNSVAIGLGYTTSVGVFNVTSGNVDVVGPGLGDFYPGNGRYVDLNGSQRGTITSASIFNFNPGDTVTLSFNYGANGANKSANVQLGSLFSDTVSIGASTSVFSSYNTTFNVNSSLSTALSFMSSLSSPNGNAGIIIDNV